MQLRKMIVAALFAALMAISSQFYIPLPGSVPHTLQVFFAVLAGIILGKKWSAVSITIWLLLGCFGLPVFTQGKSGFAALIGPTGGFLVAFILQATLCGYIPQCKNQLVSIFVGLASLIAVYAVGLIGFVLSFTYFLNKSMSFSVAFGVAVLPFIPFDAVKVVAGTILGRKIYSALKKAGLSLD